MPPARAQFEAQIWRSPISAARMGRKSVCYRRKQEHSRTWRIEVSRWADLQQSASNMFAASSNTGVRNRMANVGRGEKNVPFFAWGRAVRREGADAKPTPWHFLYDTTALANGHGQCNCKNKAQELVFVTA